MGRGMLSDVTNRRLTNQQHQQRPALSAEGSGEKVGVADSEVLRQALILWQQQRQQHREKQQQQEGAERGSEATAPRGILQVVAAAKASGQSLSNTDDLASNHSCS